ncbi:fibrillin-1-like isoform X3 [Ooceraea biroi]|uniref:fibrillin-1-like isoform X3 n=1 Tax=Ooceraea biroi TaxID=2015173 RepID=UPI0005B7E3BC|nr:fibrillin-1-like isoform X3 [Ooceraea biroi]
MARYVDLGVPFVMLLLGVVHLEQLIMHKATVAEGRIEERFEKCCSLGTSWAKEGLRCEKFTGPVTGVPRVEQGLCLETVDICCVRAYHELQCEKGKADARQGLACVTSTTKSRAPGRGDYHRDCCEGCKLGILTGSMSQGCSFKSFSFGIPWDPAFLECCHEVSPSSTTDLTSELSSETDFDSSSSSSPSTPYSPSPSSLSSSSSISSSLSPLSSSSLSPTPSFSSSSFPSSPSFSPSSSPSSPSFSPSSFPSSPSFSPSSSPSSSSFSPSSSPSSPSFSPLSPSSPLSSSPFSSTSPSSSSSDSSPSDSSSGSTPYSIPTPGNSKLDDICQLMKGMLCSDICVPTPGSYYCKCRDGFTLLEDGKTCRQDLPTDRCKSTHPCEHRCTDNGVAVICSCNPGYGLADDGRSCIPKSSKNKKPHVNDDDDLSPLCPSGYRYNATNQVCDDIDECVESNNPCSDLDTVCVNTIGAYECTRTSANSLPRSSIGIEPSPHQENMRPSSATCSAGYKPANNSRIMTCIDVDECNEQLHSCELGERCVNEIGSYRCVPENGKADKSDDDQHDVRYSRDYKPEETSISPAINKIEDCGSGYFFDGKSRRCIDVDECANGLALCGISERCVNTNGGYRCSPICSPGFRPRNSSRTANETKEFCEDIDECLLGLHTCNVLTHRCLNTNGSYACEILTTTSTSTSTSTSTTTSTVATTTKTSSTTKRPFFISPYNRVPTSRSNLSTDRYWSTEPCKLGYKRDASTGYCVDIDECVVGPGCRDHEKCTNTPGGYDCSSLCSTGWYFSTTTKGCQDVDECLLGRHDCPQGTHRCVNTNGSFICELIPPCDRGFRRAFNGTCLDIDECSESLHNCRLDLHQYCVNREGSFECLTRLPSCPSGYQYSLGTRQCEDIDECLTGQYKCDARMSERCVNLPGTYRCERPPPPRQRQRPACPSGYRYHPRLRRCTDIDECAEGLDTCGDEVCYNQPGGYSCAKLPVPITRRPTTTPMPALANEKCVDGTRFVRNRGCVDINECKEIEDACSSNEECVNTMSSYKCICKTGFRRDNLTQACVDINECQLQENDCLPTQRCDNTIGSYTCTRFLPCGTGYTLNAATEICEDDDECVLGTHDCGAGYQCRNTLGSYRCDRIPRVPSPQPRTSPTTMRTTTTTIPTTTKSTSLAPITSRTNCPRGFEPGSGGKCEDIDECQRTPNLCGRFMCINTLGSYKCTSSRVICGPGYTLDPVSGQYCIDVDECREGIHECDKDQTCENRQGGYHCICPPGHAAGPNNDCVDIDECSIYGNSICGSNGRCENTAGSYRCVCKEGFENVGGNAGTCQDIDECQRAPGLCQHVCLNVWGSYRCGCEAGFRLSADNRSCSDVDECMEFKDNNLCIGICENTPGSYACKCPNGYKLSTDGRTCLDIDECASGNVCRGPDEMCQNMRGSYRCNRLDCPSGYQRDSARKNRCVRSTKYCNVDDLACLRSPSHYSYNFITFVSMLPIPNSGPLELFTMRGTHQPESTIQFTMALVDVRALPGVARATESCFALKRPTPSQVILVLTRSIPGPQDIELDLSMEVYHGSRFVGSAVAKIFIFVSQYEF